MSDDTRLDQHPGADPWASAPPAAPVPGFVHRPDPGLEAYAGESAPANLLFAPAFTTALEAALPAWRRVVARAVERGIPAPVFSSTLAYYDSLRRPRLNAALTQGLRDYFGAHTYERVDREGTFHTRWAEDRAEVEAG